MDTRNGQSRPRILVVDDDRLILATLSKGLRQAGYEVGEANSGDDALRLTDELKPDLALLDIRMPGMSGVELAQHLVGKRIPFIFLSAYGDPEIVRQATELGALGYLVKPLDLPQVIPSLEAALARAREIRALHDKESQLSSALESGREASTAVGILMERRGLDRKEAFEALREHARAQRRRLNDAAAELVEAMEIVNRSGRPKP
jgi:AmiR/NasT family two-component response regulator